jgi:hypothetical protein
MIEDLSINTKFILLRILIGLIVAYGIILAGYRLYKGSKVPEVTKPLMVMFLCNSVAIIVNSVALLRPELERHITTIIGWIIEGGGVVWFLHKLKPNAKN